MNVFRVVPSVLFHRAEETKKAYILVQDAEEKHSFDRLRLNS